MKIELFTKIRAQNNSMLQMSQTAAKKFGKFLQRIGEAKVVITIEEVGDVELDCWNDEPVEVELVGVVGDSGIRGERAVAIRPGSVSGPRRKRA